MKNWMLFAMIINILNFCIAIVDHNLSGFCGWFAAFVYSLILYKEQE